MNFRIIFTVQLLLLFSSFTFADDKNFNLKVIESFQSYCFSTDADFKKIEQLIKAMPLKQLPEKYAQAVSGVDSVKTKLYLIEKINETSAILLGFSQPNACTISVQGVDFLPIKKIMIEQFKLAKGYSSDTGLETIEIYVPGGVLGNKKEAAEFGVILLKYPKPSLGYHGGAISFFPSKQAKKLFKKKK